MRTETIGLLVALALSMSTGATHAKESLSREDGLRVMRGVLTLEVAVHNGARGTESEWGDLAQVVKVSDSDSAAWKPLDGPRTKTRLVDVVVDSTTATVFDYTLRLTRSDDKKHFQLSLTPTVTNASDPRLSWFADDRLLIYTGKPIG
jgi:hypothetical protein